MALEAVASTFIDLCENYSPWYPNVVPLRGAVSNESGTLKMLLFNPRGGGAKLSEMNHMYVPGSKDDVLLKHSVHSVLKNLERTPMVTLAQLWERLQRDGIGWHAALRRDLGASRVDSGGGSMQQPPEADELVDIMVIDIEGMEPRLLLPRLPHPPPRMILFERKNIDGPVLEAIDSKLHEQGYEHVRDFSHLHSAQPTDRLYGIPRSRAR